MLLHQSSFPCLAACPLQISSKDTERGICASFPGTTEGYYGRKQYPIYLAQGNAAKIIQKRRQFHIEVFHWRS